MAAGRKALVLLLVFALATPVMAAGGEEDEGLIQRMMKRFVPAQKAEPEPVQEIPATPPRAVVPVPPKTEEVIYRMPTSYTTIPATEKPLTETKPVAAQEAGTMVKAAEAMLEEPPEPPVAAAVTEVLPPAAPAAPILPPAETLPAEGEAAELPGEVKGKELSKDEILTRLTGLLESIPEILDFLPDIKKVREDGGVEYYTYATAGGPVRLTELDAKTLKKILISVNNLVSHLMTERLNRQMQAITSAQRQAQQTQQLQEIQRVTRTLSQQPVQPPPQPPQPVRPPQPPQGQTQPPPQPPRAR